MADFVIRPAGDPDWGNARFLSGALPLTAVDAASLGIVMGADYEIGRVGSLTTFQVTQTGTAPLLIGSEPGVIALWDAADLPDGPVATLSDLAGPFELTAVSPPTASGGVITFDGTDDVMTGAAVDDTGAVIPGARHLRDYALPDASGGDTGQGFSIAGFAYDDADGTWWAVNGGLNYDGSSADRQQSLVHLSSDFATNLGEIDLDAVLPDLDSNDESPQAVAVDNANGYLWVASPAARVIHCFEKTTGARIPGNDITRGYDIGSLAIAEDGAHIWVMSRPQGNATIQKISTDGTAVVSVDFTLDLDNRHDHLTEKDGRLYVSCGTNGAQAFVVAIDPLQQTVLARTLLPYPGGANGLVGLEGIQFGQNGSVFIAHNGHFHYGDPGNPEAPLQWPRTNIVAEYMLPDLGGADFDLFALADVTPTGADCLMQFGSPLDSVKALPAVGLLPNGSHPSWQLRVNNAGAGDEARVSHAFSGPCLIYVARRGANVTFYINGVEAGTDTLNGAADGAWGPIHAPELGGANSNGNRHTAMDFYAAGAVLGAGANRQVIEGALAHRHGQAALLPVGHPFRDTAPTSADLTPLPDAPPALAGPLPPVSLGPIPTLTLTQGQPMAPRDLSAYFDGQGMSFDLDPSSAPLAAGLSLSSEGILSGTPTQTTADVTLVLRATNAGGAVTGNATLRVNADTGAGIALPAPVTLDSASETLIVVTLPADPVATNRTIDDRVAALVPLDAYTGNEQNPSAWTQGGAQWIAMQDAGAQITFSGSYGGDYVVVWEARDTTTDPRTDSDWSIGTPVNIAAAPPPPDPDPGPPSGDFAQLTFASPQAPTLAEMYRLQRERWHTRPDWMVTGVAPKTLPADAAQLPGGWSYNAGAKTLAANGSAAGLDGWDFGDTQIQISNGDDVPFITNCRFYMPTVRKSDRVGFSKRFTGSIAFGTRSNGRLRLLRKCLFTVSPDHDGGPYAPEAHITAFPEGGTLPTLDLLEFCSFEGYGADALKGAWRGVWRYNYFDASWNTPDDATVWNNSTTYNRGDIVYASAASGQRQDWLKVCLVNGTVGVEPNWSSFNSTNANWGALDPHTDLDQAPDSPGDFTNEYYGNIYVLDHTQRRFPSRMHHVGVVNAMRFIPNGSTGNQGSRHIHHNVFTDETDFGFITPPTIQLPTSNILPGTQITVEDNWYQTQQLTAGTGGHITVGSNIPNWPPSAPATLSTISASYSAGGLTYDFTASLGGWATVVLTQSSAPMTAKQIIDAHRTGTALASMEIDAEGGAAASRSLTVGLGSGTYYAHALYQAGGGVDTLAPVQTVT